VVFFRPLTRSDASLILDHELAKLQWKFDLLPTPFTLHVADAARERLLDDGYSPRYGAREIRRVLTAQVLDPLADMLLAQAIPAGSRVTMTDDGFALAETA
jgi:ATP-dependent Clp protease ATP-binding subunit ClpA